MLPKEQRISSKAQMKDWIAYELGHYGKRKNTYLPVTEYAILRKHIILLRKTEYHVNSGHKLLSIYYRLRLGYL